MILRPQLRLMCGGALRKTSELPAVQDISRNGENGMPGGMEPECDFVSILNDDECSPA